MFTQYSVNHNRKDGWRALLREIADQHQVSVVNDLGDVEE